MSESEREQERESMRDTTPMPGNTGSSSFPATARGKYNRSVGPRVRIEFGISLVPWISTSLDRLRAKSKAGKLRAAELHVLHTYTLSPSFQAV